MYRVLCKVKLFDTLTVTASAKTTVNSASAHGVSALLRQGRSQAAKRGYYQSTDHHRKRLFFIHVSCRSSCLSPLPLPGTDNFHYYILLALPVSFLFPKLDPNTTTSPPTTIHNVCPIRSQPRLLPSSAGWISPSRRLPSPTAHAVPASATTPRRKEPRLLLHMYRHTLLLLGLRRDLRVLS
ncbi:unnamed protein product [Fusarium graminearum]|nr:unnamed protein product [Fusarium graminearum]